MDIELNDKIKNLMLKNRHIHVKLESLDHEENVLCELIGKCKYDNGGIHVSNSNMIRRQTDFQVITDKETDLKQGSPFWVDKKLRIYIGVANPNNPDSITWFNWGLYVIGDTSKVISIDSNTISVQCYDKMHEYELCDFSMNTKIFVDTPMGEAIKSIGKLIGETKYRIQENEFVIPYDQEIDATEILIDRLQKFQEMYMNFQVHYDLDGYLCYEPTYSKPTDPIYWTFCNDTKDLEINREIKFGNDSIRTGITVYGRYDEDTGRQPTYSYDLPNGHEFSENNIHKRRHVTLNMDNYTREDQCKLYAEYQMKENYKLGKQIIITCVPLFFLRDVNINIEVYDNNMRYICCVDEINCPVGLGTMTITSHVIAEYPADKSLYGDTVNGIYNATINELYGRKVGDIGKILY